MSVAGLPQFVELLKTYREKLSLDGKNWVEMAKTGCEKVFRSAKDEQTGIRYQAEYYEHPNRIHNAAYQKEVLMCTMLAHFGMTVYLIKETSDGGSKIDAIVNDVPVDFKMVGSGNSAIKQNYQKGMDKLHCKGIIMYMQSEQTYTVKIHGKMWELPLEKAVESYTKQNDNGLLAIWICRAQVFKVFDMQKIRAAHNNAARGNALAKLP